MQKVVIILASFVSILVSSGTANGQARDPRARVFELVLPSEHLLGDWGGLRTRLERSGVVPSLMFITNALGNPVGGRSKGATAPSSIELSLTFDLDSIFGLKGGSIFTSFSQRWGRDLSGRYIGNTFTAQQVYGFRTFRVVDVSYQQILAEGLEIRLGRFATTDDFLVSVYSCGFVSSAFCGTPFGIFLNAPGITSYTGTWAVLVKAEPTRRSYVMTGFYNGDPGILENRYHGLNLSLRGPPFAIGEAGYQVNGLPGDSPLIGNYKLGAWHDGSDLADFETGAGISGSQGYYVLFDQVLVPFGAPGSNRGFGVFGSVIVAPDPRIQQMPWFFNAGAVARG